MHDCSKDVRAHHDQAVTLPDLARRQMKDRRNANRDRLCKGLAKSDDPDPDEFFSQGSYAMKTMIQDVDNDYDIDDGVYFLADDLVGARGAALTALEARHMVRDALNDGRFKQAPEVRPNCVRVYYDAGYHVDIPVYRVTVTETVFGDEERLYELACASGWKRSDARDVTAWYAKAREASADGAQLRRITRQLKAFARSRGSWRGRSLSGFAITKLVTERYRYAEREDGALYDTMVAIRDRLDLWLEIDHPVTPNETITSGPDDSKAKFFRGKLSEAIDALEPLFGSDCTRKEALACWDKAFATTFFGERQEEEQRATAIAAPAIVSSSSLLASSPASAGSVDSAGGFRHA
nr:hypothetical protein [Qipengyuania sediminis]